MYIERWEDFYAAAEELYLAAPLRTRYVAKYRHCDGRLVLKVTDDRTVRNWVCVRRHRGRDHPCWTLPSLSLPLPPPPPSCAVSSIQD